MIEHSDTFQLFVEVAIAVAGFAGVATVFGGQNRSFQAAENLRLRALFQNSALVLIGCMSLLALDAAEVEHRWNVVAVSLLVVSIYLVTFLDVPLKSIKLRTSNDSSVTVFSLSIAVSPFVVGVPLLLGNALYLRQEWPLIVVFTHYILMSLWVFYRLLTNRN